MPNYTLEELQSDGLAPAMDLLVAAAKAGDLVTYGRVAKRLEMALGKSPISPRQMGWVAGPLMDHLLRIDPDVPLINVLVVRGDSDQPGAGADSYLKSRYGVKGRLGATKRKELVQAALNEVWIYRNWEELFKRAFGRRPEDLSLETGNFEEDGQGDNPRYGGLPESREHKALKSYVAANPSAVRMKLKDPEATEERRLLSGDSIDVEFVDGARRVAVEVKSIKSGRGDLLRGIYQCVKYRAVMIAQSGFDADDAKCESVLVSEKALPPDLRAIAHRLGVPVRVIRVN